MHIVKDLESLSKDRWYWIFILVIGILLVVRSHKILENLLILCTIWKGFYRSKSSRHWNLHVHWQYHCRGWLLQWNIIYFRIGWICNYIEKIVVVSYSEVASYSRGRDAHDWKSYRFIIPSKSIVRGAEQCQYAQTWAHTWEWIMSGNFSYWFNLYLDILHWVGTTYLKGVVMGGTGPGRS